jgi:hypothetical protein
MKRFLGTVPLSHKEMRSRRRTIRAVVYGAGAVLILFTLIFPRQWWAVAGLWFVVSMGFTTWFIILRERVAAQDQAADSAHPRADPEGTERFRRRMNWNLIYGGGGCVGVGVAALFLTNAPHSGAFVGISALVLAFGLACVVGGVIGLIRRRREPESSN